MLLKRSIVTIFAALLAFVAFANARGQSSSVVKGGTLQIDASVRRSARFAADVVDYWRWPAGTLARR
jgi:hypothetical protein